MIDISREIETRQEALDWFLTEHFSEPAAPAQPARPSPVVSLRLVYAGSLSDDEVLVKAREAGNGAKFERLYSGDWSGDYPSQSEADLALLNHLAFWCNRDAEQMARLFSLSSLASEKWQKRPDYRNRTIRRAIAGCGEGYTGGGTSRGSRSTGGAAADFRDHRQDKGDREQAEPEEWQAPIPVDQPDLPAFDAGDFPYTLWRMIEGIAKATETPAELAGMNVLSTASATVQRKLTIELDPGYTEPLNTWTTTQLAPGSRKSAAHKPAIRPLLQWEIEQAQAYGPIIKAARATRAAEELRLKEVQKRFGKEQDEAKREALREEIESAEANLTEVPHSPRIIGQDITPEHLATLMSDHGERLALFSTEGGVFSIMAGRYSGGVANLDIYLQSHSGDTVRVDRGSRPSVYMREPALTMGLSVQPDVLQDMASKPGFRGRGLVGRFLYAVPPDIVGKRKLETTPISPSVRAAYDQTITALLNMPEQRNMTTGELFAIKLTPEAHAEWKAFAREVEAGMAEGGELEHMRDWAGKLSGAAGRIAGVFHCCEHAEKLLRDEMDTPERYPLRGATMQTALNLARKLVPHAIHTYALMGEGGDIQAARRVLRWIESTGVDEFTARDCHQALKGTFPRRADINPGLAILIERGHIRRAQPLDERKPGRPSEFFQVNPAIRRR